MTRKAQAKSSVLMTVPPLAWANMIGMSERICMRQYDTSSLSGLAFFMERYKCNGRYFDTLEEASGYAGRYFRRTGVVLGIERTRKRL
jgi:hypothetical protein